MSDPSGVVFQPGAGQAGQPGQASGGASEGAQGNATPNYITYEQAVKLAQQAAEEATKRAQSLTDKSESRLRRELAQKQQGLSEALQELKAAGMQIDQATEERLQQRMIAKALMAEQPGGGGLEATGSPARPTEPAAADGENHPATKMALAMMQKAGVALNDDDPETQLISQDSPEEFLLTVGQAIAAKKQRLAGPAGGRMPTSAGVGGAAVGLDAAYRAELKTLRRGDAEGLFKLKTKYRKQGLKI